MSGDGDRARRLFGPGPHVFEEERAPDSLAAAEDLIGTRRVDRAFRLHYGEGRGLEDTAHALGCEPRDLEGWLGEAEARLREEAAPGARPDGAALPASAPTHVFVIKEAKREEGYALHVGGSGYAEGIDLADFIGLGKENIRMEIVGVYEERAYEGGRLVSRTTHYKPEGMP